MPSEKVKQEVKKQERKIKFSLTPKQLFIGLTGIAVMIIGIIQLTRTPAPTQTGGDDIQQDKPGIEKPAIIPANQRNIKIYVPGVENAMIILSNGEQHAAPYVISGKDGDVVEFTIRANGYMERQERIELNHRRSSFEYSLEKMNNN